MNEGTLRVLIISYAFSPNGSVGARRMSALTHSFKDSGIYADVLTVHDSFFSIRDDSVSHAAFNLYKTKVLLAPLHCSGKMLWTRVKNIIQRTIRERVFELDSRQGWNKYLMRAGIKALEKTKYDFILVSGPPFSSFVGAYNLSLKYDTPLILDYRDAWTGFKWKKHISSKAKILENSIVHHAKGIVLCTETLVSSFRTSFPDIPANRIHIATNGFFPRDTQPVSNCKGSIRIGHAGTFYGERSLSSLIEPLKKAIVRLDSDIAIHHWGGTVPACQIKDFSYAGISESLIIHTRLSHESLIDSLSSMDLLLAFSGSDVTYAIPHKVFDYLSTGVPILAITPPDSELSRFIEGTEFGIAADSLSSECITNGLLHCLSVDRYPPPEKYFWTNIGDEYASFLRSIMIDL